MAESFKKYLLEQKQEGNYTSKYQLDEGLGDILKKSWDRTFGTHNEKKGWAVKLNFSDQKVIDAIVNKLKVRDEFKTSNALADKDTFIPAVTKQIAIYIKTLTDLFLSNHGHLIVKPEGDKILDFIFDNYTEKDPKAYAQTFVNELSKKNNGEGNIAFLAEIAEIKPYSYVKKEVSDKEVRSNIYNKKNADVDEIAKNDFVLTLGTKIYSQVKTGIDKNAEYAKRGEQIKVYSIPFKVDDSIITDIAKKAKDAGANLDTFYTELTNRVEGILEDLLEQLVADDNLEYYLGFIPVKSYGFNLYFKDRDIAEEAADMLDQENVKVTERMRYEKRIAAWPAVLKDMVNFGRFELHGPANPTDWFRKTKFAIEHVGKLVNEYFPGADDQIKIKNVRFEINEEHLQKLGGDAKEILKNLAGKVKKAISTQKDFIVMSSDKNVIVAKFLASATDENIETLIKGIFNTSDVSIKTGVLSQKEIDNYKSKFSSAMTSLDTFAELFGSLAGYNSDKDAANKDAEGEEIHQEVLKFDFKKLKDMTDSEKTAILKAIDQIKISESFKNNLFNYLMCLNEVATKPAPAKTPTSAKKTSAAAASAAKKAGAAKTAGRAAITTKTTPITTTKKADHATLADAMENITAISSEEVLELVVAKIKAVLEAIANNNKAKATVEYDNSGNLVFKYSNKISKNVKALINAIVSQIPVFIASK